MSEMVERMTAHFAKQFQDYGMTINGEYPDERETEQFAREAIAEMREPTEVMNDAGSGAMPAADGYSLADDFKHAWQAAIDAEIAPEKHDLTDLAKMG